MIDVVLDLCLSAADAACVARAVPVGSEDCAAAMAQAEPRLEAWREAYDLRNVACGTLEAQPLDTTEVAPGIHVHSGAIAEPDANNAGDVSNLAIIVGGNAVAVIDSGGSRLVGERIVATVRALTPLPITAVILTHMHPDHVFGATALADAGAEVIAHRSMPQALGARASSYTTAFARLIGPDFAGTAVPALDDLVEDEASLDLGGRALELKAWPTAHTATDLTVLDRATRTLVTGDLVFDGHAPALDGSLRGWLDVLDGLGSTAPARIVPGHGAASLPWPEGAEPLRRYLEILARDTRAAIVEGLTLSEAVETSAASEAPHWQLFDLYNPRNATAAYTELEWE